MSPRHAVPARLRTLRLEVLLLAAALASPAAATAQTPDGVRIGVTLGGTGFLGLSVELFDEGGRAVEMSVGTWNFRDVTASVVGKALLGPSDFRPVMGAGLWLVAARPDPEDPEATRTGLTLLARAPVGFDWAVGGGHYVGMDVNVIRPLWIRRTDPSDDRPPKGRIVPFPGIAYRFDAGR